MWAMLYAYRAVRLVAGGRFTVCAGPVRPAPAPGGHMRRITPAVKRAAERRAREDAAKRLNEVVPHLDSLTFTIEEIDSNKQLLTPVEVTHTRHIVVDRAPAVFDLPCYDRYCDGGHDVTKSVLRALKDRK